MNWYNYVHSDPVNRADSDGLGNQTYVTCEDASSTFTEPDTPDAVDGGSIGNAGGTLKEACQLSEMPDQNTPQDLCTGMYCARYQNGTRWVVDVNAPQKSVFKILGIRNAKSV